ncbi:MAG: hypothetical protein HY046_12990 [Acidobacteria bacterium]|nr:hypothetical protein [Acidobacteriota bacterium]
MRPIDRRAFLASLAGSFLAARTATPRTLLQQQSSQYPHATQYPTAVQTGKTCWLDVAAPFVVEDPALGLNTELLLTATCFPGIDGFRDSKYGTQYEVLLYDGRGREVNLEGAGKLMIPSLRPTVLRMADVLGHLKGARKPASFWGSARIRVAPSGMTTHAGDLFSAGFVRWNTATNFDNVHAHPAAPKQARGRFFYSMPFPSTQEYHMAFALFNPSDDESAGVVRLVEPLGRTAVERKYQLRPHETQLFSLADMNPAESPGAALAMAPAAPSAVKDGGVVAVINETEAVAFAYTFMKSRDGKAFSVEHPLHFQDNPVKPARTSPYGPNRSFPAEALLFTPMAFNGKTYGGVRLESRFYLSASKWLEDQLWLMPFLTFEDGSIGWVSNRDDEFQKRVTPAEHVHEGLLRLPIFASAKLEAKNLPVPPEFSGAFGVATAPKTSHSLMKVEVRATNWGRVAFTHFRPGGAAHQRYRTVAERGGLASDYVVSGCQVRGSREDRKYDCLLAFMNIEFEREQAGSPKVQLFGPKGLIGEKALGEFAPLGCRHLLLSELFPDLQTERGQPLTVRMMDEKAMMVVSALHMDYERKDIAMEHGSDRHSTWLDYGC